VSLLDSLIFHARFVRHEDRETETPEWPCDEGSLDTVDTREIVAFWWIAARHYYEEGESIEPIIELLRVISPEPDTFSSRIGFDALTHWFELPVPGT